MPPVNAVARLDLSCSKSVLHGSSNALTVVCLPGYTFIFPSPSTQVGAPRVCAQSPLVVISPRWSPSPSPQVVILSHVAPMPLPRTLDIRHSIRRLVHHSKHIHCYANAPESRHTCVHQQYLFPSSSDKVATGKKSRCSNLGGSSTAMLRMRGSAPHGDHWMLFRTGTAISVRAYVSEKVNTSSP